MTDIDLHKEYNSFGESLQDLFDSTEEGFFVPLYQREYTWEEDNINQLFDDLVLGTRELSENENATTFLGTIILTTIGDKKHTVKVGEERAQPTGVQLVIDGQQRISTFALISIQLIVKLQTLLKGLPNKTPYADLHNNCDKVINRLRRLHTIELGKGAKPPLKPKIIRAREDLWTYDGDDDAYRSPVAHYIAKFIRTNDVETALSALDPVSGTRVRCNVELINQWLDAICDAHIPGTNVHDQFPVGASITTDRMQEYVLGFTDDAVKAVVEKAEINKAENDYFAAAIYQIFLVTYYLLRRCGVNRLQPTREDWGFDMFQALNATGTPLTVMETFLPQVMQAEQGAGNEWDKTPSREYMDEILQLFEVTTTNEQKNLRTNELLGTFALCYEGKKLGNKFSVQRRWMTRIYEKQLPTIDEKRQFLGKLSWTANFFYKAWYMEETTKPYRINGLEEHPNGELASLLLQYLKDANSKLSASILTRFYSQALEEQASFDEFVEAAKACAAFFTLWRSANSTSGLDDIYRKYFKGSAVPVSVDEHNWNGHPTPILAKDLKQYFSEILKHKGIGEKEAWIKASERFLLYTELKAICRFVLFIAGHDRVADSDNSGLTAQGKIGACPLLSLERWASKDHKSLEHVAPQNPPDYHSWDAAIYTGNGVHEIGNLILLPIDINRFVDNKGWPVKFLHYCHVGVRKQDEIEKLADEAKKKGVVLSQKAIKVLSATKYNCAIEPILNIGEKGPWDISIIDKRTRQIKEIAWETLTSWLKS